MPKSVILGVAVFFEDNVGQLDIAVEDAVLVDVIEHARRRRDDVNSRASSIQVLFISSRVMGGASDLRGTLRPSPCPVYLDGESGGDRADAGSGRARLHFQAPGNRDPTGTLWARSNRL